MRRLLAAALALSPFLPAASFDHAPWQRVLDRFVNAAGEVDYGAAQRDPGDLDAYVAALAAASPDNRTDLFPSRADELAYWLNAYNALVMKGVVDRYPTRSVRDLGPRFGFFRRTGYTLGGSRMSLESLENAVIRKRYTDPRIHFAIVCASISCPLLSREAFRGPALEADLDRLTRESLAQRRMLTVDAGRNEILLTSLFKWYAADFGDLLRFLQRYAPAPARRALEGMKAPRLRYRDYDWSINDPGSRRRARAAWERELAAPAPGGI